MKIDYLILVHQCPWQLRRLIKRLESKTSRFFIHVDKKSNFEAFKQGLQGLKSEINFVPRENTHWGRVSLVKATLNGLREIAKQSQKSDYTVLLSGQCYPIKTPDQITSFFERNYGLSFMEHFPLPNSDWDNGGLDRIERYYFSLPYLRAFPPTNPPRTLQGRLLNSILKVYFHKPRVFPKYIKPFGGSQWFNLTQACVRYVLDFNDAHPDFFKFHRYSFVPDEIFFQSILLNAPERISKDIRNNNLRFMRWSQTNPEVLKKNDFNSIANSGQLFARKFNIEEDESIFDLIDEQTN